MSRDFRSEAEQEARQSDAYRQWVRHRVNEVHRQVATEDVLARYGVHLRYGGHKPEQFSCPFHGQDNKPSTRFYPAHDNKPAGLWCFVCQERWDTITLYKKFEQLEGSFTHVLSSFERAFGLQTPEMPREAARLETESSASVELEQLFGVCERRLLGARSKFTLEGYLQVGSILDRLHYQVSQGSRTPPEATGILRQVLAKIGEKERNE